MNSQLIVFFLEDNDDLAVRFTALLQQQGYTVHRATSVEDAIDKATQLPRIDIFVVDLMVPDTRDDFEQVSNCVRKRDEAAALWGTNNTSQLVPGHQTTVQGQVLQEMENLNIQIMDRINRQGGIDFLLRLKKENRIGDSCIAIFSSSNPDDPYHKENSTKTEPSTFQRELAAVQPDDSRRCWFQKPVSLKYVAKWISGFRP